MAFPLPPASSALALDIDGTITTADQRVVNDLVAAARASGAHVAINTARPTQYCDSPFEMTARLAAREHHHCCAWALRDLLFGSSASQLAQVPPCKVSNMDAIAGASGVRRRACAILVDDRPENVLVVSRAGYTGVLVDARSGITEAVAHSLLRQLERCAAWEDEVAT